MIIDENLPGDIKFIELIKEIVKIKKNINIILIANNYNEQLKYITDNYKKIKFIYYKNKDYKYILKEINYYLDCDKNNLKESYQEKIKSELQKKIIIITGEKNKLKQDFIYKYILKMKVKKILIVNFNLINAKNKKIKFCEQIDIFFCKKNILKNYNKINKLLIYNFNKYELIIIDVNIEIYLDLINNKNIFNSKITKLFFINNNIEVIKNRYYVIKDLIKKKNTKFIFIRNNKYYIDKNILKIIFKKINIIAEFSKNNKLINKIKINYLINKKII